MMWEAFEDSSYYDLWAVRPVGERKWGRCFHMNSREEAEGLVRLLSSLPDSVARWNEQMGEGAP